MTIFVTGGSGFVGLALLKELVASPGRVQKIYALSRSELPESIGKSSLVKVLRGDLKSLERFSSEIQESEYIFHVAANASFSISEKEATEDNLLPTQNLIKIAKAGKNLKNLVFVSSIGAADRAPGDNCKNPLGAKSVANPRSAYGLSKLKCEMAIRDSGLPFTILRPGWIYGRDMRANSHLNKFVTMIASGSKVSHFNFPGLVSLIHVNDLAKAILRTLVDPNVVGKIFFAVTESLSLGEILATIDQKATGERPFQVPVFGGAWFIRLFHHKLPLALNNLFVGYLWADERPFRDAFALSNAVPFWSGVDDIIETNARLRGKFLITGANSGIGLSLAKKLAKTGRKLILVDKRTDALGEFGAHKVIQADLSSSTSIDEIAHKIRDDRLAALVNNAGVGFRRATDEATAEEIKLTVQINDLAPVLLTHILMRQLKRDGTTIINIGSSTAYNPLPGMSIYAASKALLVNWSEALSHELRGSNTVVTLSPSGTKTGFQKAAGVAVLNDGKGLQSPDDVANKIISAFERNRKFIILGLPSKVLLLVSRFLPRSINVKMWGFLFAKMR